MRLTRLWASLLVSGLALLAMGVTLSLAPARAAVGSAAPDYNTSAYRYTDNRAAAASVGRTLTVYVVEDEFDAAERERIAIGLKQWNHVLNGYVRFHILPLPGTPSSEALTQIYRSGAWIVTKVDSHHVVAREPATLAVTAKRTNRNGGFVYVIGDRFARRDLTAVVLHEFGHVLGAGHDPNGHLMRASYDRTNGFCIDRGAVAMVAAAQRLPLNQLNWCFGPGLDDGRPGRR